MDFGLCALLKRDAKDMSGTYTVTGCTGTLRYMAPECALNQPYNEKVDIYSYGMIIYELLTNNAPFRGYSRSYMYNLVIRGGNRPDLNFDEYGREIHTPYKIKKFISTCWDELAENRPTAKQATDFFLRLYLENLEKTNQHQMNDCNCIIS